MDFLKWFRTQWDRVTAAVLVVVGLVVLLIGYLGASRTPYPAEQLPYMISGGVLGIFCLGSAAALYLSADMRDEWRKLNSIDVSLKQLVGTTTVDVATPAAAEPAPSAQVDEPDTAPVPAAKRRSTRASSSRAADSRP